MYAAQPVDGAVKKFSDHQHDERQVALAHGHEQKLSVVGLGAGGDLRAAAVLGEVGGGADLRVVDGELVAVINAEGKRLRRVVEELVHPGENIGQDAAHRRFFKNVYQRGVPGQRAGDEKRLFVGKADINALDGCRGERFRGFNEVERNIKVARKSVAASGGNDTQRGVGADQYAADGVDHSVAADHQQFANAFLHGTARFGLSVFFGGAELDGQIVARKIPVFNQSFVNTIQSDAHSGIRVDQDADFISGFHAQ